MASQFPTSSFPMGWYQIDTSRNVKRGKIHSYNYFGKSLVCFRGEDGVVKTFDAHCPHLGAHLGVGGKVDGNDLICPFHGWKFNSQGECVAIPYCKNIPKRAQLQSYLTKEANSGIFIYYSNGIVKPEFDLPVFSEFNTPKRVFKTVSYNISLQKDHPAFSAGRFPEGVSELDLKLGIGGIGIASGTLVANQMKARIFYAATPIDEESIRVTISYVFRRSWNPIRTLFFHEFMKKELTQFNHP